MIKRHTQCSNRSLAPPTGKSRRGSMLIQMVIVIIGISMAMTVVGSILFRLFRHEANVLGTVAETRVTARLASLLRKDIHTADRVAVSSEGKTLTIHQDETQIVWSQVSPDELQRVLVPAREQRDPKKIPGERFRLLGVQTQFSISDANGQTEKGVTRRPPMRWTCLI